MGKRNALAAEYVAALHLGRVSIVGADVAGPVRIAVGVWLKPNRLGLLWCRTDNLAGAVVELAGEEARRRGLARRGGWLACDAAAAFAIIEAIALEHAILVRPDAEIQAAAAEMAVRIEAMFAPSGAGGALAAVNRAYAAYRARATGPMPYSAYLARYKAGLVRAAAEAMAGLPFGRCDRAMPAAGMGSHWARCSAR